MNRGAFSPVLICQLASQGRLYTEAFTTRRSSIMPGDFF